MTLRSSSPARTAPARVSRGLLVFIVAAALAGLPTLLYAQATAPAATAPPTGRSEGDIAQRRQAVARAIADARARPVVPDPERQAALEREVALLERIDLLLGQQVTAHAGTTELEQSRAQVEQSLNAVRTNGLDQKPPYSILTLDELRDQRRAAQEWAKSLDDNVRTAEDALARAHTTLDEQESARRQAKEALDTNGDPVRAATLEEELRLRQLESRAATETVAARELELARERMARQVQQLTLDTVNEKIRRTKRDVRFTRKALDDQLVKLDKEESDAAQARESAKLEQTALERNWSKARQRLDASPAAEDAVVEEVEARRLAQQTGQLAVTVAGNRLERNRARKDAWNRRFHVANGTIGRDQWTPWTDEATQLVDQLEREQRVEQSRLAGTRSQAATLAEKSASAPPDTARWLREQQRQLDERARLYQTDLTDLDATRLLAAKLRDEVRSESQTLSFRERLGNAWDTLGSVWGYELTAVDDRPITVGKIAVGLVLFTAGFWISRLLSRLLGARVFPRMGLNTGAAAALQSLSFYLLVCMLSLLALRVINVPLTVFTILGGALAIGVGFGSQNVVNNFISGLILLAERPIKVGDFVEIDATQGIVEHIGARSTRLRLGNNTEVIVPNSTFLEKKLINWTLSDDHARLQIRVGVAYGSPTEEVARLIRSAVDGHARVLRYPEPIVLFTDFGDSALIFEVLFWLRVRSAMDRRIVESDIRHRIDNLFGTAGIVIAYPQQDVHLDTPRPLEVALVDSRQSEPKP